jgi:hypothetical protein
VAAFSAFGSFGKYVPSVRDASDASDAFRTRLQHHDSRLHSNCVTAMPILRLQILGKNSSH